MDITTTEVYKYFRCIEIYALGDLYLFHNLADKAEEREKKEGVSTTSPTTTYETTYSSGSYSSTPPIEPICRGTIPFALMMFSCMDILGYLVREKDSPSETEKNIISFFDYVQDKPSIEELKCLVQIYRHGLGHNYFPKLSQSISYHSTNPDSLFFKSDGRVVLNVNKLELYFTFGFMRIKNETSLYEQMESRFNQLTRLYEEKERCQLLD